MTQLVPCSTCARHVKKAESACPFCGAGLSLAGVAPRARPAQRLGRGATFAFGVATSLAACGGSPAPAPTDANTSIDSGVSPLYGGPPEDAGTDAGLSAMYGGPPVDAGADAGGPAPAYGGPFPDAGQEDGGGAAPLYGAPPP